MKKLIAILLLAASSSWATMAYVQSKGCSTTSGTSVTCQFPSSVSTNNLLIVAAMGSRLTACLTVGDDQGDTFNLIGGTVTTGSPSSSTLIWGIWWATSTFASQTIVTVDDPCANTTWVEASIHEYSGNAYKTSPFDVASSSTGASLVSTTTASAPPITAARNAELIFGFAPGLPSPAVTGNGTIRTNKVDNTYWATEDVILDPAAVYQSSFTFVSTSYVNRMNQAGFLPPISINQGIETWQ